MATALDELSGFEFEEVMVDVFRHQGYRDVRQAVRTADEGRDVTMADGPRRGMVATTGRFTAPAEEYAERVSATSDDALRPTTRRRLRR